DSVQTHHVERGHTLWGISQKYYGDGSRYQIIFAANTNHIRNPNLIYPGQLFVVPKPEPKP
ncbi:MAG: LysM peptidoglycan-binding domain-containing protein, partial [Roseiarcus sp.]|uniref:LysM peptidoglycan-binding domain-containing protein n=1 Tax=Roseiarcus sp. TaxID=1969460 RepID=UPI003C67167A